ncbi:T9SS type A sorting domain-containing protein [Taibaiella koreensis]|uniref:T9SS type A sorting domain-containing protein n=1 Tax=Taibaiella koreensis TaxID=1268548 RepID=UPI000E59B00A|nr:T9SS type A sorting domain-containing protein [Taibaiella koreensis]
MTNKHVLFSSIVLSCLMTGAAYGQSLGLDRQISIANTQQTCSATDMAIAFNGWIYSACRSGEAIIVNVSKDRGLSWQPFTNLSTAGLTFDAPSIIVSGNNEQSLGVFVAGIIRDKRDLTQTLFVRRYNALTGSFSGEPLRRTINGTFYACDLATSPVPVGEAGGEPSLSLLYAQSASDSRQLLQQTSTDGGKSFTTPHMITSSNGYFRNVSISYGRSDRASAGRYFMAWDEYLQPKAAWGKVYTARNTSGVTSGTTAPVQMGASDPQMAGKLRNPVLAVSTTGDNDSASCTAVLLAEYDRDGAAAIVTFTNERSHFTPYWKGSVMAAGAKPAIAFDAMHQQFAMSYYQKDNRELRLLKAGYRNADAWKVISSNYADVAVDNDPAPSIAIDPQYGQAAFTWNGGTGNNISFDAEYNLAPAFTSMLEAGRDGQANLISWNAGAAEDNGWIGMERSIDGRRFQPLAQVQQKGSPALNEYRDLSPAPGMNYYRLKLGQEKYSAIVSVYADQQAQSQLKVFPNPATNRLTVSAPLAGGTLTIIDISGRTCLTAEAANAQTTIDLQQLPAGSYIVKYHGEAGDRFEKISKIDR